jgi:hypothetical protein
MLFLFTHTNTIVALVTATGLLLLSFAACRHAAGGKYLDELISRTKSQELVDQLKPSQVTSHIQVTLVLDTLFPACYGLCLVAITLRFSGPDRTWLLTVPVVLLVFADYLENWSQLVALRTKRVPSTKPLFSIAKWICLGVAIVNASLEWFQRSVA